MKHVYRESLATVFLLFGLCFVTFVLGDMRKSLEYRPGFDMYAVERGRYLLKISGCNDCHTGGYTTVEGNIPEKLWLTGDSFGWQGPWGTTYGTNLRLLADNMTRDQWVNMAKNLKSRPPMPWFNLNAMTVEDLEAIHQFLRYLGPGGKPAPEYLPRGKEPDGPHAVFPAGPELSCIETAAALTIFGIV